MGKFNMYNANMTQEEIVNNFIEVEMVDDESFLKIKETLTRIGMCNSKRTTLVQTAHILQKRGKYYIVHFLELFALDGKETDFSEDDRKRVISIVELLENWGLLTIKTEIEPEYRGKKPYMLNLNIIDFKSKDKWELVPKYTIGTK
jgi:hypothetical protein